MTTENDCGGMHALLRVDGGKVGSNVYKGRDDPDANAPGAYIHRPARTASHESVVSLTLPPPLRPASLPAWPAISQPPPVPWYTATTQAEAGRRGWGTMGEREREWVMLSKGFSLTTVLSIQANKNTHTYRMCLASALSHIHTNPRVIRGVWLRDVWAISYLTCSTSHNPDPLSFPSWMHRILVSYVYHQNFSLFLSSY